jgi:hypothetical protein
LFTLALGLLLLPPAGRADEAFEQALSRGREQLQRGRKIWDVRNARGSALAALKAAADTAERAQAAALLETTLIQLAGMKETTPPERLTLQLQAAGAHGLRNDFPAMERHIQAAVAAGADDPTAGALEPLNAGETTTLADNRGAAAPPFVKLDLATRITAFWDAAVFYVHAREYAVARALEAHKQALHASGTMPLNRTLCTYVDTAPSGVVAWAQSPIVRDPARRSRGFLPAPRENKAIDPMLWDLLAERVLTEVEKAALADPATAFYTVYDPAGWHLYIETDRRGGPVDVFFSTSMRQIHPYRCRFRLPNSTDTASSDLPGTIRIETAKVGEGLGTALFIPWESLYNRLPFLEGHDEPWGFTIVRGNPVNLTWGGREREPGRWGRVEWQKPTAEQRLAIQRHLIRRAWETYGQGMPAVTNFWSDPAQGDPAFYQSVIQPLTARYATEGTRLADIGKWEPSRVEACFSEAPAWLDFERHATTLRREALLRQFTASATDPTDPSGAPDPWAGKPLACHVVPALSSVSRTPETRPTAETLGDLIARVGAKGEFVPASFLVDPRQDVARLEVKAGALRLLNRDGQTVNGEIPSSQVDIRVVKCWWQPGRAWFSYADDYTRRELMPDLLLHDDGLVKVDRQTREQYVRVDKPGGPEYVWISYPFPRHASQWRGDRMPLLPGGTLFDPIREPVSDAPTLQPVPLVRGEPRQFWVTVRIPGNAAEGLYEGTLALSADGAPAGAMRLRLRVLPFDLPDPKTAYDLERGFMVGMDGLGTLRGQLEDFDSDQEQAERRLRALFRNQREHNINIYSALNILSYNYHYGKDDPEGHRYELANVMADPAEKAILIRNLELVREAGFKPPLVAAARACITQRTQVLKTRTNEFTVAEADEILNRYLLASKELLDLVERVLGHRDVYFWGAGEPAREVVANQLDGFRALKAIGVKIGSEGQPWMVEADEGVVDMVNLGGAFFDRKYTDPWHARGGRALWYAGPHPGAKDPDKSRRVHGMMGYQARFDGTKNNTWGDQWLDFHSPYGYHITMIYPTRDSVIDTLQWEGFRAGIDDVRYATKLRMLAAAAVAGADAARAAVAKQALAWLEAVDAQRTDLDAMRLEMINWILRLSHSDKEVRP